LLLAAAAAAETKYDKMRVFMDIFYCLLKIQVQERKFLKDQRKG